MTRPGLAPLSPQDRASGILLHVTSLPSRYGIGDLGPGALAWIDRLHDAGQRWWQTLPLGPTGYGDSPYQPLSTFAGNELLLSPDWLLESMTGSTDRARQAAAVGELARRIGAGGRGPVTRTLQGAFFDVVAGRDAKYERWLNYL